MRTFLVVFVAAACFPGQGLPASSPESIAAGKKQFASRCAGCHGADGTGGERGPNIGERRSERTQTERDLRELIHNGIPGSGMPAFPLPEQELQSLVAYVRWLTAPAIETPVAGDISAGEAFFYGKGNCSSCHMIRGRGGLIGPDLSAIGRERKLAAIEQALRAPASHITPGYRPVIVRLRDGRSLRGIARNETNYDLQMLDLQGNLHLLRRDQIAERLHEETSLMPPVSATQDEIRNLLAYLSLLSGVQAVNPDKLSDHSSGEPPLDKGVQFRDLVDPKPGEWPTYHGRLSGNRYSTLRQITPGNVATLAPRWVFPVPDSQKLEVTPLVVDGVMYVSNANQAYALDARTGREIWRYQRPRTRGMVGDAAGGINRGVAILGDRIFMVTDNAHLIALHRLSGRLLWDVQMADYHKNYGATSAPLVVKDLVISGTSGGDEGVRGFIAAYKISTGERVWRFWTVPARGEPKSETWNGDALEHGAASTWFTGTYDPESNLLYWSTGNPGPDFNGDERKNDNLYSDCVLALKPETGEMKWYFQFTPHDVHDWDATEPLLLVDAEFQGRARRLLVQANRNGFFYVFDRVDGKLLLTKRFIKTLSWASGIGPDGRPQVLPGTDPTPEGMKTCPSIDGATNWMSSAYNPDTRLYYIMALEKCTIFAKLSIPWEAGKSFYGGLYKDVPGEPGKKYVRAIDIQTGNVVWEYPQIGDGESWGGLLSTAGGLVFFADDSGAFAALDAKTGHPLWHFHTNQLWKASPMTYMVDGKQYVAIAAGSNIFSFGLP